jgi:hypothetical protein
VVRPQTDHEDTRFQTSDVADPNQDSMLRHVVLDGPGLEPLRWSIGIDANASESLTPSTAAGSSGEATCVRQLGEATPTPPTEATDSATTRLPAAGPGRAAW